MSVILRPQRSYDHRLEELVRTVLLAIVQWVLAQYDIGPDRVYLR